MLEVGEWRVERPLNSFSLGFLILAALLWGRGCVIILYLQSRHLKWGEVLVWSAIQHQQRWNRGETVGDVGCKYSACFAAVTSQVLLEISLLFPVLPHLSLCQCFVVLFLSLFPVFLLMVYYCLNGVFPSFSSCDLHNEQLQHPCTWLAASGNV